ncbi:MAG: hypothetical protein PHU85_05270 [Phycisphaerae bacterium]|nr:hypothetical protein [Phycisphaerae bacterium]
MAESWQHRTIRDILRVLFTRWISALAIVVLIVVGMWFATDYMARVYETHVTIMSPISEADQSLSGDIRSDSVWEVVLKTQYEILTGDTVLRRTLARVQTPGLAKANARIWPLPVDADNPPASVGKPDAAIREAQEIDKAAAKVSQDDLKAFRKQVRMEVPGGQTTGKSQIFTIFVRANSADLPSKLTGKAADDATAALARQRADLLTQEFIYAYHEQVLRILKDRMLAAGDSQADIEKRYDPARKNYADCINQLGPTATTIISLVKNPAGDVGEGRVRTTGQERAAAATVELAGLKKLAEDIDVSIRRIEKAKDDPKAWLEQIPIPERIRKDNPAVTECTRQLAEKSASRIQMEQQYTADFEPLKQTKAQIDGLREQLLGALKSGLINTQTEINRLSAEAGAGSTVGGSTALGSEIAKLTRLDAERTTLEQDWQRQLSEANRARQAYLGSLAFSKLKCVDAQVATPDEPVRPVRWLNMLIASVVAVLLALTYVFLADFYDHTVKSTEDVERYLGVPVLASVSKAVRRPVQGGS